MSLRSSVLLVYLGGEQRQTQKSAIRNNVVISYTISLELEVMANGIVHMLGRQEAHSQHKAFVCDCAVDMSIKMKTPIYLPMYRPTRMSKK